MKIYQKVTLYSLLIIMVPLLVMSTVLAIRSRRTVEDELLASYRSLVDVYLNNLRHKARAYENLMEYLMTNDALTSIVANDAPIDGAYLRAGETFDADVLRRLSSDVLSERYLVSVYTDNSRAAVVSDYVVEYTYASALDRRELADIRDNALQPVYRVTRTPGLGETVVSIFGPSLGHDANTLFNRAAVIQVDVVALKFVANAIPIDNTNPDPGVYVFGENGDLVFARSVAGTEPSDLWPMMQSGFDAEGAVTATRSRTGFVLQPSVPILGLRFAFVFPMTELREKLSAALVRMGLLYVAVVGVFVLISIGLTKPYHRRLRKLIGRIGAIKRGDLSDANPVGGNDEIGLVDGHLSEMVIRLRQLLRSVYEEELELKEAQLTGLEAQINPHFLFNTLELINSIAAVHDNEEICSITERLGRMLRYNLDSQSSHWATVEEEFAIVRDYLAIYQFRFGDSFSVDLQLDPDALMAQLPRFILQPLVENSIRHGFADSPRGKELAMSARLEDGSLCLVVQDNGVGMDAAQQKELELFMRQARSDRHLHAKRGERIGLKNVFMRLLLTHAEDFRMSIDTRMGKGTRISVSTPIRMAVMNDVQTADSR